MGQKLVSTWDWVKSYCYPELNDDSNRYGAVNAGVITELQKKGWDTEVLIDLEILVGESELGEQHKIVEEALGRANDVDLVFHDQKAFIHGYFEYALRNRLMTQSARVNTRANKVSKRLRNLLFRDFKGRVERTWTSGKVADFGEISSKDQFYLVAESLKIPQPETRIFAGFGLQGIPYERLAEELTGHLDGTVFLKLVHSSGGQAVYRVKSQKDLTKFRLEVGDKERYCVAQRGLSLPGSWPYSIRVVTWGEHVLGGALLVNPFHKYCSNFKQGGIVFDLALPGSQPRTSIEVLDTLSREDAQKVIEISDHCGIDIGSRIMPLDVHYYAQLVGMHESGSMLKGTDFMYENGQALAIESNIHPGPPGRGMFSGIIGSSDSSRVAEANIAVKLIVAAIEGEVLDMSELKSQKTRLVYSV